VLEQRGIAVVTARGEGTMAASDESQLLYATANSWVLLTTNRQDFARLHRQFQTQGAVHSGIITVPQDDQHPARFAIRCAMLIAWSFAPPGPRNHLWRWSDFQAFLLGGMLPVGFDDAERALALGIA